MTDDKAAPVDQPLLGVVVTVDFKVSGHKSSEGDGRTGADIERELREQEGPRTWDSTPPG